MQKQPPTHKGKNHLTSWLWSYDNKFGEVEGFTRSEARSHIKKILGIKQKSRLPMDVILEKAGG